MILCCSGCKSDPKATCDHYRGKSGIRPEKAIKACTALCKQGDKDACSTVSIWRSETYAEAFSEAGLKLATGLKQCHGAHRAACEVACKGGDIAYCLMLGLGLEYNGETDVDRQQSREYYELACKQYEDRFICAQSIRPSVPGAPGRGAFHFDTSGCSHKRGDAKSVEAHARRCAYDCFAADACERLLFHDCLANLEACRGACTAGEAAYCRQLYLFYRDGQGVVKNAQTAATFRMRACELKDQWSCSVSEGDERVFARKLKARPLREVAGPAKKKYQVEMN